MKLPVLVLAAGRSRRMGQVKALLPFGGRTLLRGLLENLGGADLAPRVVVLGHHQDALAAELDRASGCFEALVRNPDPDRDQLSSIQVGLSALDSDALGFFLAPVDHGLVAPSTLVALAQEVRRDPNQIVVPSYRFRRGHPAWFPRETFPALRASRAGGARAVLRAFPRIHHLVVEDPQVVEDLDTPEDLARARARGYTAGPKNPNLWGATKEPT